MPEKLSHQAIENCNFLANICENFGTLFIFHVKLYLENLKNQNLTMGSKGRTNVAAKLSKLLPKINRKVEFLKKICMISRVVFNSTQGKLHNFLNIFNKFKLNTEITQRKFMKMRLDEN